MLPVGGKKPNAWGLYEMHGGVGEWCQDWAGDYSRSPADDPTGPDTGDSRVSRGWASFEMPERCRSASRHPFEPGF